MKRESQSLRVLQVNLDHSRAASAALCVVIRNCDVGLAPPLTARISWGDDGGVSWNIKGSTISHMAEVHLG
jgi:hypothetical protein